MECSEVIKKKDSKFLSKEMIRIAYSRKKKKRLYRQKI